MCLLLPTGNIKRVKIVRSAYIFTTPPHHSAIRRVVIFSPGNSKSNSATFRITPDSRLSENPHPSQTRRLPDTPRNPRHRKQRIPFDNPANVYAGNSDESDSRFKADINFRTILK